MLMAGVILGLFVSGCAPQSERSKLSQDEIKAIAKATAEIVREEYTLSCGAIPGRVGEQRCDFLRKSDVKASPLATSQAPATTSEPVTSEPPDAAVSAPDAAPEPDVAPILDAAPPPDAAPVPVPTSQPSSATQPMVADAALPPPPPKPATEITGTTYSDTGHGATLAVRVNDLKFQRVIGDIGWGAYRADKFLGYVRVTKVTDVGFDGWINGSRDDLKTEGLEVRREPEPKFDDQIKAELFRVIPGSENAAINTVTLKVTTGQVKVGQTGFAYRDGVRKGSFRVIKVAAKSAEVKLFHAPIGVIQKDKMSFRFVAADTKQLDLPAIPGALVTPQPGETQVRIFRVMPNDNGATITAQIPAKTDLVKSGDVWKIRGALGEGKVGTVSGKSFTLAFVGATDKLVGDMVAVYTPPPPPPVVATTFQFPLFWIEPIPDDQEHVRLLAICPTGGCPKEIKPGALGKIFEGEKDLGAVMFKEHQLPDRLALVGPKSLMLFKGKATSLAFKIDTTEAAQTLLLAEASKEPKAASPRHRPTAKPATRPKPRPPVAKADYMVQGPADLKAVGLQLTRASIKVGSSAPSSPDSITKSRITYTIGGQPGTKKIRFITGKAGELVFRIEQPHSELAGKPVFIKMTYLPK